MIPVTNINDLRDYQIEHKKQIYELWKYHRSVLLQMPTGTGKTRLFASIVRDLHDYGCKLGKAFKVLILVHRQELVDQTAKTLGLNYNVAHGIIMSGTKQQMYYPTQIASVQTLSRRLKHWVEKDFDFIIIDEAHHALAKSYIEICEIFEKSKILGVTATPYRINAKPFTLLFNALIVSMKVSEFIERGFLSKYDYYSIKPTSAIQKAIDNIDSYDIDGDYAISAMSKVLDTHQIHSNLIDTYNKYAKGKKGIIYTINKNHNIHVRDKYREEGYNAEAIDSDTPPDERKKIINWFKNGKIKILCNVNIFSEGFDCPDVEFIQLARPTASLSLYLQQVGRGLRVHPDLEKVIFLDNVGSYNKYGLPSSYRNWIRYFYGKFNNKDSHFEKDDLKKGICRLFTIETEELVPIEGNKPVGLIYTNISEKLKKGEAVELEAFNDVEEFFIRKKIDIPEATFIDIMHFNYNEWIQDIENEIEIEKENAEFEGNQFDVNEYRNSKMSNLINKVKLNDKWGLYNTKNKLLILDTEYDEILGCNAFGISQIKKNDLYGLYNAHTGEIVIEPQYNKVIDIISLSRLNQFIVNKGNKEGVIDIDNKTIIPLEFEFIEPIRENIIFKNDRMLYGYKNGYYCIIDNKNIINERFEITKKIGEYYISKYNEFVLLLNYEGKIILPPVFDSIQFIYKKFVVRQWNFIYGLLDENLNWIIPLEYTLVKPINEDFFLVKSTKYGILDSLGKIVIDLIYNEIKIENNIITVFRDNKWSVIDKYQNVICTANKRSELLITFNSIENINKIYKPLIATSNNNPSQADGKNEEILDNIFNEYFTKPKYVKKKKHTKTKNKVLSNTITPDNVPQKKKRPRIKK